MPQRQKRYTSRIQNIVTLFIYLTQKIRAGGHYPSHCNVPLLRAPHLNTKEADNILSSSNTVNRFNLEKKNLVGYSSLTLRPIVRRLLTKIPNTNIRNASAYISTIQPVLSQHLTRRIKEIKKLNQAHYNETHYCKYSESALYRTQITKPPAQISREYNLMTVYASWKYQPPVATNINNKANKIENQGSNDHFPNIAACCTLLITTLTIILSYVLKHVGTNRKLEICNAIENEILAKHNIDLNCLDHIPDEYLCPILHSIITNPFILDGRAYEATAIYAWIYKYGRQTVPHTNLLISQTKQQTIMRMSEQMSQVVDSNIKQSIHTWVLSLINDIRPIQHFIKTINTSKDMTCLNYKQKQDTSIEVTVSENGIKYHYHLGKYTDLNCLLQNSMRLFASEPDKRRQLRSLYAQSQQNTPTQLTQL